MLGTVGSASSVCSQIMLAMDHGHRGGNPLRFAAARAAFWLYNDLPVAAEALLFPDNIRKPVGAVLLRWLCRSMRRRGVCQNFCIRLNVG